MVHVSSSLRCGWFMACLLACAPACQKSEPVSPVAPVAGPIPSEVPAEAPAATSDDARTDAPAQAPNFAGGKGGAPIPPAELYAACKTRVEGADRAGECASDADCKRAGCSQEMCISAAEAREGVMSTCEVRPCFEVLEACGCNEGVCSWTVEG